MKKTILSLAMVFSTTLTFANDLKKDQIDFLKCIRKTINSKRVDLDMLQKTNDLIQYFEKDNAKEMIAACQDNRKMQKSLPKISYDKMYDMTSELKNTSAKSSLILKSMISPRMKCVMNGVHADYSLIGGVGVGLGVGTCLSQDGRKWGILVPTGSLNYGLGAALLATHAEFEIWKGHITILHAPEFLAGLVVAERKGHNSDIHGMGLGLALIYGTTSGVALKLIPLKNNFNELIKTLE